MHAPSPTFAKEEMGDVVGGGNDGGGGGIPN